jgi:hypothetical protein
VGRGTRANLSPRVAKHLEDFADGGRRARVIARGWAFASVIIFLIAVVLSAFAFRKSSIAIAASQALIGEPLVWRTASLTAQKERKDKERDDQPGRGDPIN